MTEPATTSAAQDQDEVIELLSAPETHGGAPVERIDTHTAIVFLAGDRALKMKRAVRYDYLDFSTLECRRTFCEAEVRLNRRTAPAIYRGVVAVTREPDGRLAIGGKGEPIEWLVEMTRFDQDLLFDRLASSGRLDVSTMPALAEAIARLHEQAERRYDHGGADGMRWVIDGNETGFAEQGAGILDEQVCRDVTARSRQELERRAALLDARRRDGFVRQCHGDLHLRNIVMLDGQPTLFDGVEFNDAIACVDVLYDLAFLLMDLWRRKLPHHANRVWNGYLATVGSLSGIALMPLFLSCRAAVRAKTSATAARLQTSADAARQSEELARGYLRMAGELLAPAPPRLLAIGGLSGTGKSTLALALAASFGAPPGAVVLRSDEIRKRLMGVRPGDRLGAEAYTAEVSRRVYAAMEALAREALEAGCSVIADAVYARPADREAIEQVSAASGVPFTGLWLEAPEAVLLERVRARRGDASDADVEVVRAQLRTAPGSVAWHRVDATGGAGAVEARARERIESA